MEDLIALAVRKKLALDQLRPLSGDALARLDHYYDVEITYASNAVEGNTLTAVETTLVIEKGITIAAKPLRDHMEALDHYDAMLYIRSLASESAPVTESAVRDLHRITMHRSQPEHAGSYANLARYVRTDAGRHEFPSPAEIPSLMGDFAAWLRTSQATPGSAFEAHLRLVSIHPFNNGNGRTARLLMNLILLSAGYPPIAVRPEDRAAYKGAIAAVQAGLNEEAFHVLLYERLLETLDDYLKVLDTTRN